MIVVSKKNNLPLQNNIDDGMVIEQINNEVVIRLPSYVNFEAMQRMIDFITLKEANVRSVATQEDIDLLAKEVNKGWWEKNGSRYVK
jgi:predicted nucleic acid-binding protein